MGLCMDPLHNLKIAHQSPRDKCWHRGVLTLLGAFTYIYIWKYGLKIDER
jgi:hypothetical protein